MRRTRGRSIFPDTPSDHRWRMTMCAPARRGRGLERREMARSLQGNLTEWAALAVRRPWNDRPGHRFINPQPDARFGNLHEGEEFDVLFLVSGCDGPAMLGFRDETRDPVAAVGVAITRKRCRSARDRTGDSCCAKQGGFDCPTEPGRWRKLSGVNSSAGLRFPSVDHQGDVRPVVRCSLISGVRCDYAGETAVPPAWALPVGRAMS